MTNQTAVTILKNLEQSLDDYCELNDEGKEAFRVAITALELFGNSEQLPSAQPDLSGDSEKLWKKAYERGKAEAQDEPHWIPCSERLPEEDHWLGGSGRQFSDEVLVSVANYDDEDIWTYISQTIDGEWALELPRHCKIIAWMPLPEPYAERRTDD